jgi:DNA polymerase-3 subunit alpha
VRLSKKDQRPWATVQIEDRTGRIEMMVWSDMYQKVGNYLIEGQPIIVVGYLERRDEDKPKLMPQIVLPLEEAARLWVRDIYVFLEREQCRGDIFRRIQEVVTRHAGETPLCLVIPGPERGQAVLEADAKFHLRPSLELLKELRAIAGAGKVRLRTRDIQMPPRRKFPPRASRSGPS